MADEFDCTTRIIDDRTEIEISGTLVAAVVVRSESGERVYLPPEEFDSRSVTDDSPYQSISDDSPYQSARDDSPYQAARDDSPYQSARRSPGVTITRDGFRIVHPEPVTEFEVYREASS